ncbi:hypothetical protein FRC01_014480, partial [Tulasnella sp. 417]
EVGKPLSELQTPRQLVHVVRDIAVALEALYDHNILHRDISEGNILLSAEPDPVSGNRAFLTDFGLAMKINPTTKLPLPDSAVHNHITGTLPFMAAILHSPLGGGMPLSTIDHDVESLFWVATYAVFRFASRERLSSSTEEELAAVDMCGAWLDQLRSPNTMSLYATKTRLLAFGVDVRLPGRWSSVQNFLSKVASLCKTKFDTALLKLSSRTDPDPQNHDIHAIICEADAVDGDPSPPLDEPAPLIEALQPPAPVPISVPQPPGSSEPTTSTSTRSKRLRKDDDAGYYARRGGDLGSRERSKRNRTGPSYHESP